jgi:hypothetical protein
MPPSGAIRKTGICAQKPTMPSFAAEPVSRYTSHDSAIDCIHVPTSEMICPVKKRRKFRWRSARRPERSRDITGDYS